MAIVPSTNLNPFVIADILGYYEYKPHPVTGVSTRVVDWGRMCTHSNINKWARYKPVNINKPVPLTDVDFKSVRHGLVVPEFTSLTALITHYRSNPASTYVYQKPDGDDYRIGDFRNYDSEAKKFYELLSNLTLVYKTDPSPLSVAIVNDIGSGINLNWNLLSLDDSYFGGVVVEQGQTANPIEAIATSAIGTNNQFDVPIPVMTLDTSKTYELFVFLKHVSPVVRYYPLEFGNRGTFKVITVTSSIKVTYEAIIYYNNGQYSSSVDSYLTIKNEGSSAVVLNDLVLYLRYADNTLTSTQEPGEVMKVLGNVTIQPGATYTNNTPFVGALPDFGTRGGKVFFNNTNSDYAALNRTYEVYIYYN